MTEMPCTRCKKMAFPLRVADMLTRLVSVAASISTHHVPIPHRSGFVESE